MALGHVVEMAIALRPLRVVGERRPALVVEEAQEIVAARGRQAFDVRGSVCVIAARSDDQRPGLDLRPQLVAQPALRPR